MTFIHNDPLTHRDTKFINILYYMPVGMLLHMDKACLQRVLARAKLVCRWLEGILELTTKLELKGK